MKKLVLSLGILFLSSTPTFACEYKQQICDLLTDITNNKDNENYNAALELKSNLCNSIFEENNTPHPGEYDNTDSKYIEEGSENQ